MRRKILALRINRRAMGVVVLDRDELVLSDGRYLPSTRQRALNSLRRWLSYWLERFNDVDVVLDTSIPLAGTSMNAIVEELSALFSRRRIAPVELAKPEILSAYGLRPLRTRQEVRQVVSEFWPQLPQMSHRVKPYVIDAAAAALLAQCRLQISPPQK